jgi:nucleotide-binding universal stress UspA family protein
MTSQIMIPLDGSAFAEAALGQAADVAARLRATLHLVMVHDEANPAESVREYLANVASDPRVTKLNPVTALLSGNVVSALEKYARSSRIDLIVMSTHGRSGIARAWLGSVADELIRRANIPVLLLRPGSQLATPGRATRKVLLPVDGTEFSEALIATAVALAGHEDIHYTLLRVLLPPPPVSLGDAIATPLPQYGLDDMRADAEAHLHGLAARLRLEGLTVDTELVVQPDVAAAIREYALRTGVDLIAMVTHGLYGWKRLALGSVSDRILRDTAVPLMVLYPEPKSAQAIHHT